MMKIQYVHHPGIVESVRRGHHPYNGNSNQKKTITTVAADRWGFSIPVVPVDVTTPLKPSVWAGQQKYSLLHHGVKIAREYFAKSSVHGAHYVVESEAHWIERILWIIFLCLGLFGSCWLIGQVWVKYRTSPTIISVQDTHYPIWNVPFPAVTVCNVNKAMHSAAIDLYKTTGLKADVGLETYLEFLKRLSDMVQPQDSNDFDLSGMEVLREKYNITMGRMMKQLAQPCETLLVACRWRGERKKCSTLFTQELSDAGYCCSFNYHALESTNTSQTVWHVNGAGYLTGLSLLLDPELDEYFSWPFSFRGLQVLVHAPYNYPDVTARGVIIGSDREAFMQISAESTYTSDNLRHLSPHDRKCFLKEENSPNKSLGGTQYSYRNCMVQCRLQHMIKLCQCAPFNYHFFKSSKTCGLADIECLSRYKGILNNVNVEDEEVPGLNNSQGISCECLPSCEDVAYRTDLSLDRFFRSENTSNFFPGLKIKNRTILHVYFKDLSSIRFRRDIIFTWNDLLASFGGIVGLFLGCSLLSLVELVYFFTLRFILRRPLTRPRNVGVSQDQLAQTGPFAWTA